MAGLVCGILVGEKQTPCQKPRGGCPLHPAGAAPAAPATTAAVPASPGGAPRRDLRAFSWWLVDGVLGGEIDVRMGSVIGSLLRIISALGPEPQSEEEAYKELALRGRLMTGLPPRTQEEWDRVARFLDDEALAELRTWPMEGPRHQHLLERDSGYAVEPEFLRDSLIAADEADMALLIDHED